MKIVEVRLVIRPPGGDAGLGVGSDEDAAPRLREEGGAGPRSRRTRRRDDRQLVTGDPATGTGPPLALVVVDGAPRQLAPPNAGFAGVEVGDGILCDLTSAHAALVRRSCPALTPRPLGTARSFGFGDRLGRATAGRTCVRCDRCAPGSLRCSPSSRRASLSGRGAASATCSTRRRGARSLPAGARYGADADHLQDTDAVAAAAAAGFDPSRSARRRSSRGRRDLRGRGVGATLRGAPVVAPRRLAGGHGTPFLAPARARRAALEPPPEQELRRAAVKYGRAVAGAPPAWPVRCRRGRRSRYPSTRHRTRRRRSSTSTSPASCDGSGWSSSASLRAFPEPS